MKNRENGGNRYAVFGKEIELFLVVREGTSRWFRSFSRGVGEGVGAVVKQIQRDIIDSV